MSNNISAQEYYNLNRIDEVINHPYIKAVKYVKQLSDTAEVKNFLVDLKDTDTKNIRIVFRTDAHFGAKNCNPENEIMQLKLAKYCGFYILDGGDPNENANGTQECVSSFGEQVLNPGEQMEAEYVKLTDPIVKENLIGKCRGNHSSGKRTKAFGYNPEKMFLLGTDLEEKYSETAYLVTFRMPSNNDAGYIDYKVGVEHGDNYKGADAKVLNAAKNKWVKYGADLVLLGDKHAFYYAEYREMIDGMYKNILVAEMPASCDNAKYAIDRGLSPQPNGLLVVDMYSIKNPYNLGATKKEKEILPKEQVCVDILPLTPEICDYVNTQENFYNSVGFKKIIEAVEEQTPDFEKLVAHCVKGAINRINNGSISSNTTVSNEGIDKSNCEVMAENHQDNDATTNMDSVIDTDCSNESIR